MTLEPILNAAPAIQIHVATIVPAFIIGTWMIFASRKGSPTHRLMGKLYLVLMAITATAAIFIHEISPNGFFGLGFSFIHLFVLLTYSGIVGALVSVRRGDIRGHRNSMIGVYVGGILIAGGFTFIPGRIMHDVFFS